MDPDPCLSVAVTVFCVAFLPLTADVIICGAVVLLLLIASALIFGSEAAYLSLSADNIKKIKEDKSRKSQQVIKLLSVPEKLSAVVFVADCFINMAVVVLFVYATSHAVVFDSGWGFVLQATIITLLILIFGEVVPGTYASQHAVKIAYRMAYPLSFLQKLFYPLVMMLASSDLFVRKQAQKNQSISIDDLSDVLESAPGAAAENENILKGIVKFGNIDTHTIMTPRMDIESVDINTEFSDLLALINESGYSRIPVYDDAPDNVKGILYVKDLLPYIEQTNDFDWRRLIRDAYFVPENKKIDDLLKEFQEKKIHMAVIIDEYGGMVGIVTLEDILEEIVGDIADESDDDEPDYVKVDDNTYLFDGKVLLNDFYRIMRIDDTFFDGIKGEADTLAGIVLELKGEIPRKGDCVDYKNLSFCIESADNRRIKQIKITINDREKQ